VQGDEPVCGRGVVAAEAAVRAAYPATTKPANASVSNIDIAAVFFMTPTVLVPGWRSLTERCDRHDRAPRRRLLLDERRYVTPSVLNEWMVVSARVASAAIAKQRVPFKSYPFFNRVRPVASCSVGVQAERVVDPRAVSSRVLLPAAVVIAA
jgi:hypothetical protein